MTSSSITQHQKEHSIEYNGKLYATLDFRSARSRKSPSRSRSRSPHRTRLPRRYRSRSPVCDLNQRNYRPLPKGWILAPFSSDVVNNVVAPYEWHATLLMFADGKLFSTAGHVGGPGQSYGHCSSRIYLLERTTVEGKEYAVSGGNCRILIECLLEEQEYVHEEMRASLGPNLWQQELFTDFVLVCGSQQFKCHRAVLASVSPVFKAMFETQMSEASLQQAELADVSLESASAFVKFVYTGTIRCDQADPIEILLLADKYEVDKLVAAIYPLVLKKLDAVNVVLVTRTLNNLSSKPSCEQLWNEFCEHVKCDLKLFTAVMKAI